MAITQFQPEEQNASVAPTLGTSSGIIGQGVIPGQQGRAVSPKQKGSGRFTNLQSYIRANEPESGGLNPNARLVQQRAEQAGTQLGQRQSEFTQGLEPIRTGLQNIQGVSTLAQSAFQDPSKFVQTPENLQRFTAIRTGKEMIPGITETYGQVEPLRQGLTSQQRQISEGLRTDVGQNLQEYLKSTRQRPELATLGEQQLDKFLTEQTPSGQSAIESAVSRAGQIESMQAPSQETLSQLETLKNQLVENPLATQSGILNRLGTERGISEQTLRDINNLYLAKQVGLGSSIPEKTITTNITDNLVSASIPSMGYTRPTNLENVTPQKLQEAQAQTEAFDKFNAEKNDLDFKISGAIDRLRRIDNRILSGFGTDFASAANTQIERNRVAQDLADLQNQKNQLFKQSEGMRTELIPLYREYANRLGRTRDQLLTEYDPATLARIQALSQLSGQGFGDMLGAKIV